MFKNGWGAWKRAAQRVLVFTCSLLWISYSQAIIYSYDGPGVGYQNAAGEVRDIVGKYDSTAQLFSWSATFGRNSSGPNPKDLAPGSGFGFAPDRAATTTLIEFLASPR
jgi:hypothetical protein